MIVSYTKLSLTIFITSFSSWLVYVLVSHNPVSLILQNFFNVELISFKLFLLSLLKKFLTSLKVFCRGRPTQWYQSSGWFTMFTNDILLWCMKIHIIYANQFVNKWFLYCWWKLDTFQVFSFVFVFVSAQFSMWDIENWALSVALAVNF